MSDFERIKCEGMALSDEDLKIVKDIRYGADLFNDIDLYGDGQYKLSKLLDIPWWLEMRKMALVDNSYRYFYTINKNKFGDNTYHKIVITDGLRVASFTRKSDSCANFAEISFIRSSLINEQHMSMLFVPLPYVFNGIADFIFHKCIYPVMRIRYELVDEANKVGLNGIQPESLDDTWNYEGTPEHDLFSYYYNRIGVNNCEVLFVNGGNSYTLIRLRVGGNGYRSYFGVCIGEFKTYGLGDDESIRKQYPTRIVLNNVSSELRETINELRPFVGMDYVRRKIMAA